MKQLESLHEIAERQLGGLQANAKMLGEIKLKAASPIAPRAWLRPALAICTVAVLCFGFITWAVDSAAPGGRLSPSVLDSQPAGDTQQTFTHPEGTLTALDLPSAGVSVGKAQDAPAYRSIFEEAQGGNFPMILVNNQAYRMLKSPGQISDNLLAESVGEITEYNLEPALSSGGVVSNAASQGEAVYAVQGMKGAMVAANVNGTMRAFQRVSFAGSAVIGNESLADTLCGAGDVISIELSGVGAIDDAAAAQGLMETLLDSASYQSASVSSGGLQSLLLGLRNGLTLQLMVSGDSVSACGTWSCPEFFEAFTIAMEN